jgi:hypothetical protein
MNQQIRNKVNLSKVEPRPSNDNILAQFLGGIGSIGQGVGEAIGQAGTGIAGGIGQGVELIGQGIGEMNKTPEGRLALRELAGAALRGVGQEDLGVGVQQFAQRVYKPEAQRALFETKQKAEAKKAEKETKKEIRTQENKLRTEFNPFKKQFQEAQTAQDKVVKSLARQTAAGDVSAVFAYMKVLDPGSVVREGEQATARNAAGVPERIRNAYNRTLTGESLTPEQRQDFLETSQSLFESEKNKYEANKKVYEDIAVRQGLNVLNVIGENKTNIPVIPKGIKNLSNNKTSPVIDLKSGYSMEVLPDA